MHVVTTADGPLTPVGVEQRVEALRRAIAAAAVVGVGPAGTQQVVVVVVPPRRRRPDRRASRRTLADAGLPPPSVPPPGAAWPRCWSPRPLPIDIRHASKIDRAAAGPLGRPGAGRRAGRTPVRVLVTGASGMLGAGVARALAGRGDDVTVLQRRPAGLGPAARCSPTSPTRPPSAGPPRGQDAVVHLAAKVDVTGRVAGLRTAPTSTGTAAVVDACRAAGVGRLVHVSSPSVAHAGSSLVGVGAGPADPARARGALRPEQGRGRAARPGAPTGRAWPSSAIRPHLVWGPGDTQLVARIVERARAGRLPLVGSGAALIDSTYVDNAVDALVAALDRCERGPRQALVVTNGEPRPVAELIAAICAAAGVPPPRRRVPPALA